MTTQYHSPLDSSSDGTANFDAIETSTANTPARPNPKLLYAIIGVLAVAVIGTTTLWLTTSSRLTMEAAVEAAAAQAVPDLQRVADSHFGSIVPVSGDAEAVSITITEYDLSAAARPLGAMLDELGFSSAVIDRMGQTRALDGTQSADGNNCNVTWTYHPDDGLQLVFEAVAPN